MPFKIVCFGEILFDVFSDKEVMGGAPFNFGYHLHQLDQQVEFLTKIGTDEYGSKIKDFFKNKNLSDKLLQVDDKHATGWVEVTLDSKGKPDYIIHQNVAWDFIDYNDDVKLVIKNKPDLIYFGSLAQRNLQSRATLQKILELKSETTKTFCDINLRQNFYSIELLSDALKQSNIVKVNDEEFEKFQQMFNLDDSETDAAKQLLNNYQIDFLCITKGEKGSSVYTPDKTVHWENTQPKLEIVDTVGAGDSFSSILILGILNNWSIEKFLKEASKFAQKICTIPGAIPETPAGRRGCLIHSDHFPHQKAVPDRDHCKCTCDGCA